MISKLQRRRSGRKIWFLMSVVATLCNADIAAAQPAPTSAGPVDPQLIEDLVAANRILADQACSMDGGMSAFAIRAIPIATCCRARARRN